MCGAPHGLLYNMRLIRRNSLSFDNHTRFVRLANLLLLDRVVCHEAILRVVIVPYVSKKLSERDSDDSRGMIES